MRLLSALGLFGLLALATGCGPPEFKGSPGPGEPDLKGGEVIAEYGKGLYVYSAYAWFRQLPKGVPGAYRLIANLVSLSKTKGARSQSAR